MVTAFPSKEHQPKAGVTAGVSLLCCFFVLLLLLQLHDTAFNPCCQVLFFVELSLAGNYDVLPINHNGAVSA